MTTGSEQAYPDYIGRNQKAWSDRDSDYAATMHAKWAGEQRGGSGTSQRKSLLARASMASELLF